MSLQTSASSDAFRLLHPLVQRWVYREGWKELRDVQGDAILAIIPGGVDVLISAPTAAGKTEAAFLPLLSRAASSEKLGIRALYVGPLKALINDQFQRLEGLCEELDLRVTAWHGDVAGSRKSRLRKDPAGIVLITPESLEALFVNHGAVVAKMFYGIEGIVIDEVHSFIGTERGAQLQSLLHRLEAVLGRNIDRIGLSATLGNPQLAAEFLRPNSDRRITFLESRQDSAELRALIVGFEEPDGDVEVPRGLEATGRHIYEKMRGGKNLVFANSRTRVEELGDFLIQHCEKNGVPVDFGVHHGSLSKDLRLESEDRLKSDRPFTAVCTSTLEMGIDIGSMDSIGQVGVPPSVASLRQRVGRSGRRGGASPKLWMYAIEKPLHPNASLHSRLRTMLVQQTAMLGLLAERWCEPPRNSALHLSTLVQQCLSSVAERGGIAPLSLYRLLCSGPFANVSQETFVTLLRDLGQSQVITSSEDGTLLADIIGERMLSDYRFYSAFSTPEEFRIVNDSRTLGTLPIDHPVHPESYIVFGGRRWQVTTIDEKARIITVTRAAAGKVPQFGNDGPFGTHREVRQKMRALYASEVVPPFLDTGAADLLRQGRSEYSSLGLSKRRMLKEGQDVILFLWDGDYVGLTVSLALRSLGLKVEGNGLALEIRGASEDEVCEAVNHFSDTSRMPSPEQLAEYVPNKIVEKHDGLLSNRLLSSEYAARWMDLPGASSLLVVLGDVLRVECNRT